PKTPKPQNPFTFFSIEYYINMESKEQTQDESLDQSINVVLDLDKTEAKLIEEIENIDNYGSPIKRFNKEISKDVTYESDHDSPHFHSKEEKKVKNYDDDFEEDLFKHQASMGTHRYGPATQKWKRIMIKHKIIKSEKLCKNDKASKTARKTYL